uniref:UDP-glycosyltransferase n=1 Tax=Polyphagotarsonemus latus TaxID=1204166 RepID=A0AAN0LHW4_9ACAR
MVKICFVLLLERGHFTICSAIGKYLLAKDIKNEIYFIVDDEFENIVRDDCNLFKIVKFKQPEIVNKSPIVLNKILDTWKLDKYERYGFFCEKFISLLNLWRNRDKLIAGLIDELKPDFVFIENLFNIPSLMNKDYKWGMIISTNPLRIGDQENHFPMNTGCVDKEEAKKYLNIFKEKSKNFFHSLDDWYKENNLIRKPSLSYVQGSEYLNIFLFPEELNYFQPNELSGKWFQIENTIINSSVENKMKIYQNFNPTGKEILTKEFLQKPGKLILVSLGTVLTRNIDLFKEIIPFMKNIPHKFIVSKGKFGDQIELPNNCIGSNFLNQLEFLPMVDLFISHGGNNSLCEAFYFGVPMVIIPGFGDQIDNAAILENKKLSKTIFLNDFTEENLKKSIDFMFKNENIKNEMSKISEKIKKKDKLNELCELILKECSA